MTHFAEVYVAGDHEYCKSTGRARRRRAAPKRHAKGGGSPPYVPTLEEIALGCLTIQASWPPAERRRRLVGYVEHPYEVPVVAANLAPEF